MEIKTTERLSCFHLSHWEKFPAFDNIPCWQTRVETALGGWEDWKKGTTSVEGDLGMSVKL